MRAMVCEQFGGPEVLQLREVPLPVPGPGQVRVAVHAAGTNPVDAGNRRDGSWAGIEPPVIPGAEASGVIDTVGPGVSAEQWAAGDEVFYLVDVRGQPRGTYAEYHVVDADLLAPKPPNLSHIEAAALPLASGTAYEMIVRRLAVRAGEWLLLYGAAGGVGSAALQLAVAQGARVIAVARSEHHPLLQRLGAAACVDYTQGDVVRQIQALVGGGQVDAVADCVGGGTVVEGLRALRPYGRAATIAGVQDTLAADWDPLVDANLVLHGILIRPEQRRLVELSRLVACGALRPIIAQVLPLAAAADAHRRLETRHGYGKLVLRVR